MLESIVGDITKQAKQARPKLIKMNEDYLNKIINEHPFKRDIDKDKARLMGIPVEIDNTTESYQLIF